MVGKHQEQRGEQGLIVMLRQTQAQITAHQRGHPQGRRPHIRIRQVDDRRAWGYTETAFQAREALFQGGDVSGFAHDKVPVGLDANGVG